MVELMAEWKVDKKVLLEEYLLVGVMVVMKVVEMVEWMAVLMVEKRAV